MSKNGKVVTFGEVMLRLAPPGYLRILQTNSFEMTFGGAEVNVAVGLAQLGMGATFVTRLPNNDLAQACINQVRGLGVDTTRIVRGGERMGVYFVEKGVAQRASTVLYDRAHSAIAEISPAELDWDTIFEGASWFHWTGITPALSDSAAQACLDGAKKAKEKGLRVSCDLNYRKKLWTREKAGATMASLLPYVDVCVANEEDAETVFGITAEGADLTGGKIEHDQYTEVAEKLIARFPNLSGVAITLRESFSASRNGWSGMLYMDGKAHFSRRYEIDQIVDRVGGGDSFGAGLIYSLVNGRSPQEAIEFAAAASCLKHSIQGDFNLLKRSEVETLVGGDASGRVQR
jgi:2-dehydro-3-deoxygluconokinase